MVSQLRALRVALLTLAALAFMGCKTMGSGNTTYRVRVEAGDTLAGIAMKYDTSWDKIAKLNGIAAGRSVKVGAILRIQPGPGGLVAGAPEAPRAVARTRTSRPENNSNNANVTPASASEFTEEDIPVDDAAARARDPAGAKRRGLLFSSGSANPAALVWPLQGEISSRFGMRGRKPHKGIDIRSPKGADIVAAGAGVVEFAGRQHGYGRTVIINHGTYRTLYGHLNSIAVLRGERVAARMVVGEVGTSGNASGPHLHFEVRTAENKNIDPLSVLEEDKLLSSRR